MPILLADGREFPISNETWEAWKSEAQPFELPDDVLRRLLLPEADDGEQVVALNAARAAGRGSAAAPRSAAKTAGARRHSAGKAKRTRVASDLLLPEEEYEMPILRALAAGDGRLPTREVVVAVGEALSGRLTELDREPVRDGGPPRWENRVQFARLRLVKAGLMEASSPRGVWEISDAGAQRAKAAS